MKYRIHRLDIKLPREQERLDRFLNGLKGEVVSIIPNVKTFFLYFGARVDSILVVEKLKK